MGAGLTHIYMHIYIHMYAYVCIYTQIYIYVNTRIYTYTYMKDVWHQVPSITCDSFLGQLLGPALSVKVSELLPLGVGLRMDWIWYLRFQCHITLHTLTSECTHYT